ncbi:MAG TPA: T6SS effector amidase Tae4 family protein [Flavisolibacter sp.]|nr:T6SS effector amidase Tae4 family protein [Flavisolibacter sp.]
MRITFSGIEVVEENHFYPYGLQQEETSYTIDGITPYRHGFQGQFAERDKEVKTDGFELRMYSADIGRWMTPDPYGQFSSGYVGMGNDPANSVDPDGGWAGALANGFLRTGAFTAAGFVAGVAVGAMAGMESGQLWQAGLVGAGAGALAANAGSIGSFIGNNAGAIGKAGSIGMPAFKTLWKNYPHNKKMTDGTIEIQHPSDDAGLYNQCAVRLGKALIKSGVSLKSYDNNNKTSEGYPRSAQQLADWLYHKYKRPVIMNQADFNKNYSNKTGIIFEDPYPGSGPHIDLWNKGKTGSGYHSAAKIWFFEVK